MKMPIQSNHRIMVTMFYLPVTMEITDNSPVDGSRLISFPNKIIESFSSGVGRGRGESRARDVSVIGRPPRRLYASRAFPRSPTSPRHVCSMLTTHTALP